MGGECDGSAWVSSCWADGTSYRCKGCVFQEQRDADEGHGVVCQVVEGREPAARCPELEDYIRYEGIRQYGVNKVVKRRR